MVACEARPYTRTSLLLLWLGVFLSLSGLSQSRASQYLSSPEVVIPWKVTNMGRGKKAPVWLSYSLQFGGQRHIVHMRVKKLLVSRHFPVFTYTEQHALLQDQPFVQDDCYYHGYVEGALGSMIALSTCSGGFRGMLHINGFTYEIEPIRHSTTFEHLVYKINSKETQFPSMRCGLTEGETAHQQLEFQKAEDSTLKQVSVNGWWTHSWFLELVVVVDHDFFSYSQSNLSNVQEDVFLVINMVDSIYQQLSTYVILIGIEIWNQGNFFPITNIEQILEDFSHWKQISLSRLQHDAAHLFVKNSRINALGLAYVAGICHPPIDCGVNSFQEDTWFLFALTVAHELGHTLGMWHDEEFCLCADSYCIMNAVRMKAERFTNCSYAEFRRTTLNQGSCLHNLPRPGDFIMLKRCGNGMVEGEEECDCGSIKQCEKDPCCLLNCTLSPGSTCAFGLCCKNCKFMPSGELCRQQINECDLPEWCNGTSHQCPEDGYVQDGIPCSNGAYCYQKRCNSPDKQCREIFGKDAKSGSQSCYKEINSQGNHFGHCGINGTKYLKCNNSNIFCGRVQCENVGEIPHLQEPFALLHTYINGVTCWGINYHLGYHYHINISDVGDVKDGTVCGPGKICIHKKCISVSHLSQVCLPETCNMKGVCNNKHHCHCGYGWSPPYCLHRGYGGSVDSGPASAKRSVFLPLIVIILSPLSLLLAVGLYKYLRKYSSPKDTNVQTSG
ncbi:disintegrin and metalloproteinase domain-containing protein 21-like [Dasypus novemcinctus]|uniref:disintegrin and metalloproteinase domain-containing protein 21-like n=1 Tax=Dasypus novemcinctus TaxID=9361 RepID=UPI00265FD970|nr:disintegrin and metalloproteinase domain-containing protein 21-like [Dasypus novemcinctus]XP_058150908.1 disintegrin and metalloproteinase domain-containing protein 21-like [Dasypus novemcinctus]XP_058150909.1 disintegrin and metalloproteinase domain-containing protein 21-like [Dasypus novemcinctus]